MLITRRRAPSLALILAFELLYAGSKALFPDSFSLRNAVLFAPAPSLQFKP